MVPFKKNPRHNMCDMVIGNCLLFSIQRYDGGKSKLAMNKKWYRLKRKQTIIICGIWLLVNIYILLYTDLYNVLFKESDLDLIRREEIQQNIQKRLEEALKEEKGSGCTIPKLDPFSKEATQFDVKMPKVICPGLDWVTCYLSECHVIPAILDIVPNVTCTYRDIIYHSDNERSLGPPRVVNGTSSYTLTDSDHVYVKCTSHYIARWSGHKLGFRTLKVPKSPKGRENSLNVLFLAFDSTSKIGFIRLMPKSYKVLTEELGAIVMNGYNIVGHGTQGALFPILTGHTELELPDFRIRSNNNQYMDDMPLIFKYAKEDGYRTAYFEDSPRISFKWLS